MITHGYGDDVFVCLADPARRPLGDRRLHPGAAAEPARRRSPTCPPRTGASSRRIAPMSLTRATHGDRRGACEPGSTGSRRARLIVGGVGLALCLAAWLDLAAPRSSLPTWSASSSGSGSRWAASALTMLHHLVGGSWGLLIRRPLEAAAMTLLPAGPAVPAARLRACRPLSLGRPEAVAPTTRSAAQDRLPERRFFLVRAAGLLRRSGSCLAFLLDRLVEPRRTGPSDHGPSRRLQPLSGPGLVAPVPDRDVRGDRLGDVARARLVLRRSTARC